MSKTRFVSIGLSVLAVTLVLRFATNQLRQVDGLRAVAVPAPEGPSAIIRSLRPRYPYSVISGGVYTPAELSLAHSRDTIVRAHYAGFDVAHAHLVKLTADRFQYASYRINDHIFWTRNKLRIPKGELLLTDGTNYARARCGNRLSDTPKAAVSPQEPDHAILAMPDITPQTLPNLAMADPPALSEDTNLAAPSDSDTVPSAGPVTPAPVTTGSAHLSQPGDPVITGFTGSPVISSGPVVLSGPVNMAPTSSPTAPVTSTQQPAPPVNPVPEPGTLGLFLMSLVVSVFALLRMMPKDESNH